MAERFNSTGEYAWVAMYNRLLGKELKEKILSNPKGSIPIDQNRVMVSGTVYEDHIFSRRDYFERLSEKVDITNPVFDYPKFCEDIAASFFNIAENSGKLSLPGLVLIGSFCRFKVGQLPGTMSIEEPHILTTFPYSFQASERPIVLLNTLCQRYSVKNFFYNDPSLLP